MDYKKIIAALKSDKKNQAIDCALRLFAENGIEGVKMTDIARDADVGVASLYRYFDTKEKLAVCCGIKAWSDLYGSFAPSLESEEYLTLNGYGKLAYLLGLYRDIYRDHKDFVRFITVFDSFCISAGTAPAELADYSECVHLFYPYYEQASNEGIADGSVKKQQDTELFYRTVNHAMMAVLGKILQGGILEEDKFNEDTELALLAQLILSGIKNK